MTKPHTTLSEAVRALSYPVEVQGNGETIAAFDMGLAAAAALVEQHEAQEPVGYMSEGAPGHLKEWFNAGMPTSMRVYNDRYPVRNITLPLYAQPTLAATQAGDAPSERDMAIAQAVRQACVNSYSPDDSASDYTEKMGDIDLATIIRAAMSPTTTRSE